MIASAALHVTRRPAQEPDAPTVVFVHGSLDRSESFRRVVRRLPDLAIVCYDRRGYQGSRGAGVTDLGGHVDDLLGLAASERAETGGPVVAVGHSFGGDVVVAAALADPLAFGAIGAYEPPMPWLGFRRQAVPPGGRGAWLALADDPGDEAEAFYGRMMGPSAWDRLTPEARAARRADGPALVADLNGFRLDGPPFDVCALTVPAVFGMGGPESAPHHRRTVEWLAANVPGATGFEIAAARHGAHLSHPDHFAALARQVAALATPGGSPGMAGGR